MQAKLSAKRFLTHNLFRHQLATLPSHLYSPGSQGPPMHMHKQLRAEVLMTWHMG